MASAWGKSWGRSWGNSWGQQTDTTGGARKNDDDWFKYHSLEEWRRKGREEFGPPVADPVHSDDPVVARSTPSKIEAGESKDSLNKPTSSRKLNDRAPADALSMLSIDAGFAFPADRKLTDAEAVTLLLLLSET